MKGTGITCEVHGRCLWDRSRRSGRNVNSGQTRRRQCHPLTCTLLFSPVIQSSGTPVLKERACIHSQPTKFRKPLTWCFRSSVQETIPHTIIRSRRTCFLLRGSVIYLPWGEDRKMYRICNAWGEFRHFMAWGDSSILPSI